MSDFKVGDKLISKVNDCGLTKGKQYRINRITITTDAYYLDINDDHGNTWHYTITDDQNIAYYYADYFYTKSELRDMKLTELGIYE
jgi:hypothetical protein